MVNALSVDLEDWYHICGIEGADIQNRWQRYYARLENNLGKILSLFEQHKVRATFFTVGIIAQNAPQLIKKIADAGHELATHGFSHRRIFDMNPAEFEQDLLRSKSAIEEAAGKRILGYRAPEWSLKKNNIWSLEILKKHGFLYDASAVPLTHLGGKFFRHFPYQIKTKYGSIIEFPLSTYRCLWERFPFSGGLPMRITPYFYILDCAKMINRMGYPVMFYLHPWEFDAEHIKIDLPVNRKFMHYYNLGSTVKKIKLLLERMEFSTVEDVLGFRESGHHECNPSSKHDKHYDVDYFKSAFLFLVSVLSVGAVFFIIAFLMGQYAFLLIIVISTVFYWPWGLIFNKTNNLFQKKQR